MLLRIESATMHSTENVNQYLARWTGTAPGQGGPPLPAGAIRALALRRSKSEDDAFALVASGKEFETAQLYFAILNLLRQTMDKVQHDERIELLAILASVASLEARGVASQAKVFEGSAWYGKMHHRR